MPPQYGREGTTLEFTLQGGDFDAEPIEFTALAGLPDGAQLDPQTGEFRWTPDFEDSGQHVVTVQLEDPQGATDTTDVVLRIDNVNRPPVVATSHHAARLGETLDFFVTAADPDLGTSLTYTADHLPQGASLDAVSGRFLWTPGPSQRGEYVVSLNVSDGQTTSTQDILIRAEIVPAVPSVVIELTPSFPAVPGQSVLLHVIADSLAEIVDLQVTVDGQSVVLDSSGRVEIAAGGPGKTLIEAVATDADGLVGRAVAQLKVRDPSDAEAPSVVLDPALSGAMLTVQTSLIGTVADVNLDQWQLDILGRHGQVIPLAAGDASVNGVLAELDPETLPNGFWTLRLSAQDISGRTSTVEISVEVNTPAKPSAYRTSETDLSLLLGGVPVELVRAYDSLRSNVSGSLGNGWSLMGRDVDLELGTASTGHETAGVFKALADGTRLYLTPPGGNRTGFTFTPQKVQSGGLTYYRPTWLADSPAGFSLQSVGAKLSKIGNRFYDLATGRPYHPASPFFDGADYTLTAADGTQWLIDSEHGIVGRVTPDGKRLAIAASGITGSGSEAIGFVRDEQGRITSATAPDGTVVSYEYDAFGNLTDVYRTPDERLSRYGYDATDGQRLVLAVGSDGGSREIVYDDIPSTVPLTTDLQGAAQFTGNVQTGALSPGQVDRYSLTARAGEIESTSGGTLLLRVAVTHDGQLDAAVPQIAGLVPVHTYVGLDRVVTVFAVENPGHFLLKVAGADETASGSYKLYVDVAGDLNSDGLIDGVDSQILAAAQNSLEGGVGYLFAADFDGDGDVDSADRLILLGNFGFAADQTMMLPGDVSPLPPPAPSTFSSSGFGLSAESEPTSGGSPGAAVPASSSVQVFVPPAPSSAPPAPAKHPPGSSTATSPSAIRSTIVSVGRSGPADG